MSQGRRKPPLTFPTPAPSPEPSPAVTTFYQIQGEQASALTRIALALEGLLLLGDCQGRGEPVGNSPRLVEILTALDPDYPQGEPDGRPDA